MVPSLVLLLLAVFVAPAHGVTTTPFLILEPEPDPEVEIQKPPPDGFLTRPCGLGVDSLGRLSVSDYYNHAIDVFNGTSYVNQTANVDPLGGPCGVALSDSGQRFVNNFHRNAMGFGTNFSTNGGIFDSAHPTGVAYDPSTERVYVDNRTYISVYDPFGKPIKEGGQPLKIGSGTLGSGYGLAVSGYAETPGFLYVPDASTNTVKVYDPSSDTVNPQFEIKAPLNRPFVSLRDSAIAADRVTGEIYFADLLAPNPEDWERPEASIYVYSALGTYKGRLKYNVVDPLPPGIAVDNSTKSSQGRVYVSSGQGNGYGAVYGYYPSSASGTKPLASIAPQFHLEPAGKTNPTIQIGSANPGDSGIACEGDACQPLPSPPVDPTLTSLLQGRGNPRPHYRILSHRCSRKRRTRRNRRCGRQKKRHRRQKKKHPHRKRHRASRRVDAAAAFSTLTATTATAAESGERTADAIVDRRSSPQARGLLPGSAGFTASMRTGEDAPATAAGSHPYQFRLAVDLDQGGGGDTLRNLRFDLPPGLLLNPSATGLCSSQLFAQSHNSAYGQGIEWQSCPVGSQVGTVELRTGHSATPERFGVFNLTPSSGSAGKLGFAAYGYRVSFDLHIHTAPSGAYALDLQASDISASLGARGMDLVLWGTPWRFSHHAERGDCLNKGEPSFAWALCTPSANLAESNFAFITLPTACSGTLPFSVGATSWKDPGEVTAQAVNRNSSNQPVGITNCDGVTLKSQPELVLSSHSASTPTGLIFRLQSDDQGLTDPRVPLGAQAKKVTTALPPGLTINPSVGTGLSGCTDAQYAAETAFSSPGSGCPNAAKIGDFDVQVAFYKGTLTGAIYIATADHQGRAPGDPADSVVRIYLIAKSAQRGILVKVPGQLVADPADGSLTAVYDNLPQLPYTSLEVNFRSGQRAPLVTPSSCGDATSRLEIEPWAGAEQTVVFNTASHIEQGAEGFPCPTGPPTFSPTVVTGGVNANVGSYTPYFVRLSRKDTEQEITSYSLALPTGITAKLAGIPLCSDAAIEAARNRWGFDEMANPSCPSDSVVGHTDTGFGVGQALNYSAGKIYLAGPHNGQPLSLVTINPAVVGPFDLGTIVVRSAFAIDPHTARLRLDADASDPIPHIINGVPLHLRDVRIYMDRAKFTHNPTSCEASEMVSTITGSGVRFADSSDDSSVTIAKRFQMLNCLTLGFEPKLGIRLRGGSRRGAFPSLRASYVTRGPRDADLQRLEVAMPHALFLAQNHIRGVCNRVAFAAEQCPKSSIYGKVRADTPLLDEPLLGKVYLRSSSRRAPDIAASLRSGETRIVIEGAIGSTKDGGIFAYFENLPDAPIDRFVMTLFGGKRGLLVNSSNVCTTPPEATIAALGANNVGAKFDTVLRGQCKKKKAKRRHRRSAK